MSTPSEFGLKFKPEQMAHFAFMPLLSSMLVAGTVGKLMNLTLDMLFYSLIVISGAFWVDVKFMMVQMKEESGKSEDGLELKELILK